MTEDKKPAGIAAAEGSDAAGVQAESVPVEGSDAAGVQAKSVPIEGSDAAGVQAKSAPIESSDAAGVQAENAPIEGSDAAGVQDKKAVAEGQDATSCAQYGAAASTIKHYNKLVRDKIPEIIAAGGKTCVTEVLTADAYLQMLDAKLDEELAEYHADQNIEELADLLEVIFAAAAARGCSREQLEQVRADKADKRGGFEKRLLLKEVKG